MTRPEGCRPTDRTSRPALRASSRSSSNVRSATYKDHHQQGRRRVFAWSSAGKDHDAAGWARGFGAAYQDGRGFAIGPVVEDALQYVEVCAAGQRVEKALCDSRHPISHARRLKDLMRPGHCSRQVDQRAAHVRPAAQHLSQQRSRAAPDINHRF